MAVAGKIEQTFPPEFEMTIHADGTECKEGTQQVPVGFVACCEAFQEQTFACDFDIRYEWYDEGDKTWVIAISESAGGGGISINFCPHCGANLERGSQSPNS